LVVVEPEAAATVEVAGQVAWLLSVLEHYLSADIQLIVVAVCHKVQQTVITDKVQHQ
jgi:hypothetical protein